MSNNENFEFKVKLNNPDDAILVTRMAKNYQSEIDIQSNDRHYVVDAKSLMGILCLDLAREIIVSTPDDETGKSFMNDIAKYVVK